MNYAYVLAERETKTTAMTNGVSDRGWSLIPLVSISAMITKG